MISTLLIKHVMIVNDKSPSFIGDVYVEEGKIVKIGENLLENATHVIDGTDKDLLLFPGFIDMHIHGSNGSDMMDATNEALHMMASSLVKEGVTSFLATTITQSIDSIEAALRNVANYKAKKGEASLLGVHLEGPYISSKRAGAQPIEHITLPSLEQFNRWQQISNDQIKQVTVAPEVEGGMEFVSALHKQGVVVSIGHSDATIEQFGRAVQLGASQATHLYNQMRPFHHRDPGVVGGSLLEDSVNLEMIVDFIHSHPKSVEFAYRLAGASRIILITDAMRAKGLPYGNYDLGGQEVHVTDKGAHLSSGALAGSVLSMEQAVKNMYAVTNCSLQELVAMSSSNAAKQLRLTSKGSIQEGRDADLVLLDRQLNVVKTICKGYISYTK